MKKPALTASKGGFTLVEAVIASCAVVLGLTGVLLAFTSLTKTARMANQECDAMHRARWRLEELRTYPFAAPELSLGRHSISGGQYTVSAYTYPSTKQIDLSMEVIIPNGVTSHLSVATVVTSFLHK